MNAMQRFKELSGKTFPSYGDVLKVAIMLGYRRAVFDLDVPGEGTRSSIPRSSWRPSSTIEARIHRRWPRPGSVLTPGAIPRSAGADLDRCRSGHHLHPGVDRRRESAAWPARPRARGRRTTAACPRPRSIVPMTSRIPTPAIGNPRRRAAAMAMPSEVRLSSSARLVETARRRVDRLESPDFAADSPWPDRGSNSIRPANRFQPRAISDPRPARASTGVDPGPAPARTRACLDGRRGHRTDRRRDRLEEAVKTQARGGSSRILERRGAAGTSSAPT